MNQMTDVELYRLIKHPSCKAEYNKAYTTLYHRYQRLIDKQWYKLKASFDCGWTYNYKEDFYSLANEAFFKAVERADESKFQDNFKFVQMLSWLVGNARINLSKEIIKREKPLIPIEGEDKDSDEKTNTNPKVEYEYYNLEGYKDEPSYVFEKTEEQRILTLSIENCRKKWTVKKKKVYSLWETGKNKMEISKELNLTPKEVKSAISVMKNEIKRELTKQVYDESSYLRKENPLEK